MRLSGGRAAGLMGIAHGLHRQHLGAARRQSKGKGAKPGKQIGDRRAIAQPVLRRRDQCGLAIGGRLQERTRRKRHADRAQPDGHRFRFPHRFGAITLIQRQPGEPMIAGEIEQRLGWPQAFDRQPFDGQIDALFDQRQFDIGGELGMAMLAFALILALTDRDQQLA